MTRHLSILLLAMTAGPLFAASIEDAPNFRQYNELLSSSGQPDAAQIADAASQGYERLVYLAFTHIEGSLEDEDHVVRDAGLEYVHIPVVWEKPTVRDFRHFAAVLESNPGTRTLVHCQVNFRASSFAFLYRVIVLGDDIAAAKADLDSVWPLNETWFRFIHDTLEAYDIDPDCDACDWGEYSFLEFEQ